MKNNFFLSLLVLIQLSCSTHTDSTPNLQPGEKETPVYFPVTNFIKGQINEIKADGINPVKYRTTGDKTDSVWMKIADFDVAFKDFVEPVIDSLEMVNLYDASSFSDETLDTYTFTYALKKGVPDTIPLKRWDVYINRSDNKVKSIYMVKQTNDNKETQHTWQSGKWCKTVSIATDKTGKQFVEYEETIKWSFD